MADVIMVNRRRLVRRRLVRRRQLLRIVLFSVAVTVFRIAAPFSIFRNFIFGFKSRTHFQNIAPG